MSTTGESTQPKDSSSLSSSDLISRYLAATPSYLYDNPPVHHNFFFSEMLRSFLPIKNETIPSATMTRARRRKRSWKDSRDRPLELTINKKANCDYHPATQTSRSPYEPYYHPTQSNPVQQYPQLLEHRHHPFDQQLPSSSAGLQIRKDNNGSFDDQTVNNIDKQELNDVMDIRGSEIEQKNKLIRKYYLERLGLSTASDPNSHSSEVNSVKTDDFPSVSGRTNYTDDSLLRNSTGSSPVDNTVPYAKGKPDFNPKSLFSKVTEDTYPASNFRLQNTLTPDFPQSPFWHPQYPLPQTYPAIDPLHFFVDLRVSGHIWDQNINTSEKSTFSRNKHSSAFDVPQSKEYNRPLNLTRSESNHAGYFDKSTKGPHHILKNIKETYQKIWTAKYLGTDTSNDNFHEAISLKKSQIIPLKTDKMSELLHNRSKKEII